MYYYMNSKGMSHSNLHSSRNKFRTQNMDNPHFSNHEMIPTVIDNKSLLTATQAAENSVQHPAPLNLSMKQSSSKCTSDSDTESKQRKCKKLLKPLIVRNKIGEICSRKVVYFSEYLKTSSPDEKINALSENSELPFKCKICNKSFLSMNLLLEHECLKILATNAIIKCENTEIVDIKQENFELLKSSNDENFAINMTNNTSSMHEELKTSEHISEDKLVPKSTPENVLQSLQTTDLRYVTPKMRLKMFKYKLFDFDSDMPVKLNANNETNEDKNSESSSPDLKTPKEIPECSTKTSDPNEQSLTVVIKEEPEHSDHELTIDLEVGDKLVNEECLKQESSSLTCNHCNQTFKKAISLALHLRHVKYCNICEKKLTSAEFSSHIKDLHTVKYVCKFCNKDFKSELQKQKHEKLGKCRENFCRFCNIKLENRLAFETHIVQNHASKQKCPFCDRVLKRRILRHYHKHTSVTPWLCVCKICNKNFSFKTGHTCTQVQEQEKPKKPMRNIQCRKLSFTDHDSSHNARYQTIKYESQVAK